MAIIVIVLTALAYIFALLLDLKNQTDEDKRKKLRDFDRGFF